MTLASMTGFARATGQDAACAWTWEAKSVNGRALDVRCRVPAGFDPLESAARALTAERIGRGSVTLNLQVARHAGQGRLVVNRVVLDQVLALVSDLGAAATVAPPRLDGLLRLPGVVEAESDEDAATREAREAAMTATLRQALDGLVAARAAEGARLAVILGGLLDDIAGHVQVAAAEAAAQPEALRKRLRDLVAQLLEARAGVPEERLVQELALLVVKGDVREELDRLAAHVAECRALLAKGQGVGRKLGFLAQELHREANTLTSKSVDVALTRHGIALKVAIDQFREQALNVE
ncbi:MAG: YicC family protein [Alphaproteobacteria bacterium]|nr:YicC family protein [Alphaproteobacteria bacterium]